MRHIGYVIRLMLFSNGVLGSIATAQPSGSSQLAAPTLKLVSVTKTAVTFDVIAGTNGAPSGFTVKWGTTSANYTCGWSLAGNSQSVFCLLPGGSYRVTVGDPMVPALGVAGVSNPGTSCTGPLNCDTNYYFAVFAHAEGGSGGLKKSDDSVELVAKTAACNPPPTVTCPADVLACLDKGQTYSTYTVPSVSVSGGSAPYTVTVAAVAGATSLVAVSSSPTVYRLPQGTTVFTVTATGSDGRSSTCSYRVYVGSCEGTCGAFDFCKLVADAGLGPTSASFTGAGTTVSITCTTPPFSSTANNPLRLAPGNYPFSFAATNPVAGRPDITGSLTVSMLADVTAPVPVVATLPTVTSECPANLPVAPKASDNCDGAGAITGVPDKTGPFSVGTHTITWTYRDAAGNTSTQTQTAIVQDTTKPVAPTLGAVSGECSATVTAPTTTDNCAGTVTASAASYEVTGSDFTPTGASTAMTLTGGQYTFSVQGYYLVTWTFSDGNGNSTTQTQKVIVKDTAAPVPDVASLPDVTGQCSATATAPTATDACVGKVTATTSDALTYSAQGTYTITWTFSDGNGNSTTQTQKVIVKDTAAPDVTLSVTAGSQSDACSGQINIAASATDACTGVVSFVVTVDGTPVTLTAGALSLNVPAGTHTVVATAKDGAGNTYAKTQAVSVAGGGYSVSGKVFKDANFNRLFDSGESGAGGFTVTVTNGLITQTAVSAADGSYTVSGLVAGIFTVKITAQSGWINASATSVGVELGTSNCAGIVNFGQIKIGAGGGLTLGFWSNKNGQSFETAARLAALGTLNLRNADGTNFDPTSPAQLSTWLTSASATNMANMLSAQMTAMWLNVNVTDSALKTKFGGSVRGDAYIHAPGTASANALGFAKVGDVIVEANLSLGASPLTIQTTSTRSYQEALKNALDNANNNRNFVQ